MKILLSVLICIAMAQPTGGGFFNLSFTRLDGTPVATSTFSGKKTIIFAFNGTNPDVGMLQYLDSVLQANADSLAVLAVPGLEFDSTASSLALGRLRDSLGLHLIIAGPALIEKRSGTRQIPLFQWLTTMTSNGHFNRDVEEEGQLFVISGRGTLYSVINAGLYRSVLSRVVHSNVREQIQQGY
jgi:hypothetical protein